MLGGAPAGSPCWEPGLEHRGLGAVAALCSELLAVVTTGCLERGMKWKASADRTRRVWVPAAHAKAQWCSTGGPMRVGTRGELWKPLPAAPGEHTPAIMSYRGN